MYLKYTNVETIKQKQIYKFKIKTEILTLDRKQGKFQQGTMIIKKLNQAFRRFNNTRSFKEYRKKKC